MTKQVLVYLHNGYADWEIGYVLPELVKAGCSVRTVAAEGATVTSLGGLRVHAELSVASLDPHERFDLVILPGGDSWNDPANHQAILAMLPAWHRQGCRIAGICGAVTALARMGLLDTVRHTSNYLPMTRQLAPQYRGAELHSERLAESDRGVITASGIGAMEFACEILKTLNVYSEAQAEEWLNFYKKAIPPQWLIQLASSLDAQ